MLTHILLTGLLARGVGGPVLVCAARGLARLLFECVITRTGSKLFVLFEVCLRTDTFMVLHGADTGGCYHHSLSVCLLAEITQNLSGLNC